MLGENFGSFSPSFSYLFLEIRSSTGTSWQLHHLFRTPTQEGQPRTPTQRPYQKNQNETPFKCTNLHTHLLDFILLKRVFRTVIKNKKWLALCKDWKLLISAINSNELQTLWNKVNRGLSVVASIPSCIAPGTWEHSLLFLQRPPNLMLEGSWLSCLQTLGPQ